MPQDATQLERLGIVSRAHVSGYELFLRAVVDATLGGRAFRGFWFHFGIRNDSVFAGRAADEATAVLVSLTVLGIAGWAAYQLGVMRRLVRISRRYGVTRGLRLIGTDPFLNLYAGASLVLFGVYAFTGGYLTLQGRYWYPVLLPIVILSVRTAGASGPRNLARRATTVACAFWALYASVAAPLAVVAMERGFYHRSNVVPRAEIGSIESIAIDGRGVQDFAGIRVPAGASLSIAGSALDTSLGLPAKDVRYRFRSHRQRIRLSSVHERAATGSASVAHLRPRAALAGGSAAGFALVHRHLAARITRSLAGREPLRHTRPGERLRRASPRCPTIHMPELDNARLRGYLCCTPRR